MPTTVKLKRPRVHCIDDDPDILRAIKLRLQPYGADVIVSFNGMQGFWTSLDTRPDVILLDLRMPDGEGDYVFARLSEHPLTHRVPVIVLTGVRNPAVRRKLFSMGAAAYLTKPINFNELILTLRRYIPLSAKPVPPHASTYVNPDTIVVS